MSEPTPQPDSSVTVPQAVRFIGGHMMGYGPTRLPGGLTIPASPIRGFAQTTGLGLLGGYLGSKAYNLFRGGEDDEKARRTRAWMLAGGLATGIPAGLFSASEAATAVNDVGPSGLLNYPQTPAFTPKEGHVMQKIASHRIMSKKADFGQADNFPVGHSLSLISTDPMMTPVQKAMAMNVVLQASGGRDRGMIGFGDLVRGAVGAGLGYIGGIGVARTMDALLGLPDPIQKMLHASGAIGGALVASGLMPLGQQEPQRTWP